MITLLLVTVFSYLVGSIPGSLWVGRGIYGVDLRQHGSGNPGATNAYRVLGWKAGLLSTLVDMGKGFVAAGLISRIRVDALPAFFVEGDGALWVSLICGLAAVIGHMFPVFARFKGGKGVNTAAGVLFGLSPIPMLITLLVFILVLTISRYVSLSSMIAAAAYPTTLLIGRNVFGLPWGAPGLVIFGFVVAAAIIVAHHSNIRRLIKGTENKIRWVKTPTVES